jgi:hypothetical protein
VSQASPRAAFRAAAWSWADHLRRGGTTPWLRWVTEGRHDVPDLESRGRVPGATQLELVRRLNLRRSGSRQDPPLQALADRALRRSAPGRGPAHLPLVWPGDLEERRVGAPPTDPARLSADELARAGTGLLADLLATHDVPAPPVPDAGSRRPWHRAFHLAGPPVSTEALRRSLAAAGHHEGGRRPQVVLLAEPLDVGLAQVWSTRVQHGAPVRWVTFAGRWARRDQLPPSTDLPSIASWWADRVGRERVHVVTGPAVRRTAAEVLGLRTAPAAGADPRSLSPAGVDVLRRLNRVLNVRLPEERRAARLRWVAGLLPEDPAPALDVPDRVRDWVDARARRLADDLAAGGYAVHGDLALVAPRHQGAPHPRNPDVLGLVLDTCLRAADQLVARR